MHEYAANLKRVVDGDTVVLDMDLGFTVNVEVTFRLLGINAPELKGATKAAGQASKNELERLLSLGSLVVRSEKPLSTDKYGRWLAHITVKTATKDIDVNQALLDGKFAEPYL